MDHLEAVLSLLRTTPVYWAQRIAAELTYAGELAKSGEVEGGACLEKAAALILDAASKNDAVTREMVLEAEGMLSALTAEAKRLRVVCAGHAHIDMNWMWRWDETVAVTLDTFRTVLDLMDEYPGFKFSQSQASVYRIVAEYAPEMLPRIKARIAEGRWEVTASTWVEGDKNLPSGESLARQILYAKRFLADLLAIDPDDLTLDFEPDTFGHSLNMPEILADGGIRYYYHCRGAQDHTLYRWQAPSGRSVIAYREPFWYHGPVGAEMALPVPGFCARHGIESMLRVYGVGDHGGGPTRRDLERIIDLNGWPIFPRFEFGTCAEFFAAAAKIAGGLPVVEGERNFIFTGCYTSQARIKHANRIAENSLGEAETYAAMASLAAEPPRCADLSEAWRNVLFSQFHDILPGSGTVDTREYALGMFQNAMASAGCARSGALRSLAACMDTADLVPAGADPRSTAEGAGPGFGVGAFRVSQCGRGNGRTRVFHVFNPLPFERREVVEFTLWDWDGDLRRVACRDTTGRPVPCQSLSDSLRRYWAHYFCEIAVLVEVPAGGYATYVLEEGGPPAPVFVLPVEPRIEPEITEYILENELVRAVFERQGCRLVSLVDRRTGEELVTRTHPAGFRYILEDDGEGMTAWRSGRFLGVTMLDGNAGAVRHEVGAVRGSLTYELLCADSRLTVAVTLDRGSDRLDFEVGCDWVEIGRRGKGVPRLDFILPCAFPCTSYRYDVPFGVATRRPMAMDVPANSWAAATRADGGERTLMIVAEGKHGFRGDEDSMSLALLRGSYDPDPYPEVGSHAMRFAVCLAGGREDDKSLIELAQRHAHPCAVLPGTAHTGKIPAVSSLFVLEHGSAALSAVKRPEEAAGGKDIIVRVYETDGRETVVGLKFSRPIEGAWLVDLNENELSGPLEAQGERVRFALGAHRVAAVRVMFA